MAFRRMRLLALSDWLSRRCGSRRRRLVESGLVFLRYRLLGVLLWLELLLELLLLL